MAVPDRFLVSKEEVAEGYKRIGRFITSCSDLDGIVSAALGSILGMTGEAHDLVLHSIDFNRKREIMRSLFGLLKSDALKEVSDICDKADSIMQKRNIVAHGIMHQQDGKLIIATINMPAMLKYAAGKTDVLVLETLDELSDKADDLTKILYEIVKKRVDQIKKNA